jgi:hypothetical protein
MIRCKCPKCAKALGLKDDAAGKVVKCPACGTPFKAPTPAPAAAKAQPTAAQPAQPAPAPPAPAAPAKPVKAGNEADDFSPYVLEQLAPRAEAVAESERVDELVIMSLRQKKRNQAWELIGLPAKWMKRVALGGLAIWIFCFLWTTGACVLYMHKLEQASSTVRDPRTPAPAYIFPFNEIFDRPPPDPGVVFGIAAGVFVAVAAIYGTVLAGAEAMKRMESYGLALTSALIACIIQPPLGILSVIALMREDIRYQFEITRLRRLGLNPYEEEDLALQEEAEEDDDEDEEDEDEDEDEAGKGKKGTKGKGRKKAPLSPDEVRRRRKERIGAAMSRNREGFFTQNRIFGIGGLAAGIGMLIPITLHFVTGAQEDLSVFKIVLTAMGGLGVLAGLINLIRG